MRDPTVALRGALADATTTPPSGHRRAVALTYGLLGTLVVHDGEQPVPVTAPKQRALLAALLLRARQVVPVDRLLADLWGEQPPPQALAALHAYVSHLRRALEPDRPPRAAARVLVSSAPGYLLAVEDRQLDTAVFEDAVRSGTAQLAGGRPDAAHATLSDGLALWRGPALAEFAGEPFARIEALRLEELRAGAVEARLSAVLALGRPAQAVGELEQLVVEHPLRERLWSLLVLALYRCGRQSDALAAVRRCRAVLVEEVGVEPGPDLRALEAQVLAQAAGLDWLPPTARLPRPAAAVPVPRPAPEPDPGPDSPLLGRARPLAVLDTALSRALSGQRQVVLLSGDAGIGKTRLAEELDRRARLRGADVLVGRCVDGADAPPYWPWTEALRDALTSQRPAVAAGLAAAGLSLAHLAPVLPELARAEPAPEVPPSPVPAAPAPEAPAAAAPEVRHARFHLARAVTAALGALAADAGLVLLLEDLHWADPASLQLLEFAATQTRAARLLVAVTYRDGEIVDGHPFVATSAVLARETGVQRIALTGLGPDEVERFMELLTDGAVGTAVARTVQLRTEGNPFYVTELVRLLAAEGALRDRSAAAGSAVPLGVRDVVRRRVARLPEQVGALLTVAAVLGQEFSGGLLATSAAIEEEVAEDVLDLAVVSGLVLAVPGLPGRYRFSHALVRETLYAGLSAPRRARLHATVGRHLEAGGGDVLELAGHYSQAASVVGADTALDALLPAAEVALSRIAYERAEELLRRALALLAGSAPGPERDRRELWLAVRLGVLLSTTRGQAFPEVEALFVRAQQLCGTSTPPPEELSTGFGLFLADLMNVDLPAARGHARDLVELAPLRQDPRYLLAGDLATGLTLFQAGQLAAAGERFARVVALADSLDDPTLVEIFHADPRVSARCYGSYVLALRGKVEDAAALAEQAQEIARRHGHTFSEGVAETMNAWLGFVCREPERTWRSADDAIRRATELGFLMLVHGSAIFQGWADVVLGRPELGLARARQALTDVEQLGIRFMLHANLAVLAEAEQRAGELGPALATVDRALAEVGRTGEAFYAAELHRLRGELLAALDPARGPEADAELRRAVHLAAEQGAKGLHERAEHSLQAARSAGPVPVTGRG